MRFVQICVQWCSSDRSALTVELGQEIGRAQSGLCLGLAHFMIGGMMLVQAGQALSSDSDSAAA